LGSTQLAIAFLVLFFIGNLFFHSSTNPNGLLSAVMNRDLVEVGQ
jgi:hypothetical protein